MGSWSSSTRFVAGNVFIGQPDRYYTTLILDLTGDSFGTPEAFPFNPFSPSPFVNSWVDPYTDSTDDLYSSFSTNVQNRYSIQKLIMPSDGTLFTTRVVAFYAIPDNYGTLAPYKEYILEVKIIGACYFQSSAYAGGNIQNAPIMRFYHPLDAGTKALASPWFSHDPTHVLIEAAFTLPGFSTSPSARCLAGFPASLPSGFDIVSDVNALQTTNYKVDRATNWGLYPAIHGSLLKAVASGIYGSAGVYTDNVEISGDYHAVGHFRICTLPFSAITMPWASLGYLYVRIIAKWFLFDGTYQIDNYDNYSATGNAYGTTAVNAPANALDCTIDYAYSNDGVNFSSRSVFGRASDPPPWGSISPPCLPDCPTIGTNGGILPCVVAAITG